jgi:hypothetical protein
MVEFMDGVRRECGNRGYDYARFVTNQTLASSLSHFLHSREEIGRQAR